MNYLKKNNLMNNLPIKLNNFVFLFYYRKCFSSKNNIHMDKILDENHWDESKQKGWERFVGLCENEWTNTPNQVELLGLLKGDKDMAVVVNYQFGDSAIDWLYRKVPALGNRIPINCLKSETSKISLREALWQMPSR